MRPGQNKRMRGRPNNNSNGGGANRKGPNPLTRSYESNGPDVKIRGNAHHVAEKYLQLARDAQSSGDPVAAESYLQHAEHYFRLIASAQAAQAGYSRQPDAVDTEGEDEDDSGIPDRFASPVAPAPFVPQPAPQPYAAERQPYNGERPAYQDRQTGGERPAYQDRQANGERQPYADRNNFERPQRQDRQDRNGINRRPYRDNVAGGEVRTDDRQGQDRPAQDRQGQERQGQDRQGQDRPYQDRPFQDRQSRRERFAQERNGQERTGNGQDRGYDRQDRGQGYRDGSSEPSRDPYAGEQPRIEAAAERPAEHQPESGFQSSPDPMPRTEAPRVETPRAGPASQPEPVSEPVTRAEPAPRRQPRAERVAAPPPSDEAPGLPSFITTPTRVTAPEPSLATETSFPGDGADDAPKFPRRRRRTTRTATAEGDAGTDQPTTGD